LLDRDKLLLPGCCIKEVTSYEFQAPNDVPIWKKTWRPLQYDSVSLKSMNLTPLFRSERRKARVIHMKWCYRSTVSFCDPDRGIAPVFEPAIFRPPKRAELAANSDSIYGSRDRNGPISEITG